MTARRSAVILAVVAVLLVAGDFLFTAHYVRMTQANARKAGQVIEAKLCSTLEHLAALRPPPGNPGTNPSRAYEQELHATLAQLGPDIGC